MIPEGQRRIGLDVLWDLKFDGRLGGKARITRREGDLLIPGDPPIPLGLKALVLDVTATPTSANASRLDARINLATDKMGVVNGTGTAVLAVDAKGGMAWIRGSRCAPSWMPTSPTWPGSACSWATPWKWAAR